jgi:hypothetical protein
MAAVIYGMSKIFKPTQSSTFSACTSTNFLLSSPSALANQSTSFSARQNQSNAVDEKKMRTDLNFCNSTAAI